MILAHHYHLCLTPTTFLVAAAAISVAYTIVGLNCEFRYFRALESPNAAEAFLDRFLPSPVRKLSVATKKVLLIHLIQSIPDPEAPRPAPTPVPVSTLTKPTEPTFFMMDLRNEFWGMVGYPLSSFDTLTINTAMATASKCFDHALRTCKIDLDSGKVLDRQDYLYFADKFRWKAGEIMKQTDNSLRLFAAMNQIFNVLEQAYTRVTAPIYKKKDHTT